MTTWITAEAAAQRLGIKRATLYAYVSRGLLESHPDPARRGSLFDLDEIDGLSTYPGRAGSPGFTEGGIAPLTEALQLRPTWINGAGDTPGQSGAIVAAMLAVASGLCRHVLCYRTVWESSYAALVRSGTWAQPAARAARLTS